MKILIAEDNEKELHRAVEIAQKMGFEVITSAWASEASKLVCRTEYLQEDPYYKHTPLVDGVITDIFMPYFGPDDPRHNSDSPCGVMVALAAKACGIPAVFCTGGYHHGSKFQWIQSSGPYTMIHMIDGGSGEEMDGFKDWKKALEFLKMKITERQ